LQFNDHRIGEDFLFNLKVFSLAKNVSYFSGLYYLHRSINSNSYTNSLSCSKIIVLNDAYLDGKEFLSKNKYSLEVIYQYQVLYIKLLSHMLFIASFNSLSLSGFIASYQTARLVIPQFNYFNSIKFSASIILRVFIIRSPYLIWLLSKALKTIGCRTQ
jgi:hypothetical protein